MYPDVCRSMCLNLYTNVQSLRQAAMLQGKVSKSKIANWNNKHGRVPRPTTKTTQTTIDFVEQKLMRPLPAAQIHGCCMDVACCAPSITNTDPP